MPSNERLNKGFYMSVQPSVVVMGGGTGTFPVITALKRLDTDLTTIIAVSDSGGSSGRIRDEFGFQPVGDLRQSLAALAEREGEEWIRRILLYRFEKGNGLKGHNLGNLILTALQDMTGSTIDALEIAEKVFRLDGRVIPVTNDNVSLAIHYQDGSSVTGEHILDEKTEHPKKIDHIALVPPALMSDEAATALTQANLIVIGPGDLYASLMATLVPQNTQVVFGQVSGKIVYIVNLMTRLTQTDGMKASHHVSTIEKAIGRAVDTIIINSQPIGEAALALYAQEHEFPVVDDLGGDKRVIRADIVAEEQAKISASDTAHRSLIRHDSHKLQKVLAALI